MRRFIVAVLNPDLGFADATVPLEEALTELGYVKAAPVITQDCAALQRENLFLRQDVEQLRRTKAVLEKELNRWQEEARLAIESANKYYLRLQRIDHAMNGEKP